MEEEILQTTDDTMGSEPSQEEISSIVADESAEPMASQPEFNPQEWGYKYKGQMLYPKDRSHVTTLMQQAHAASQKASEFNKRMEEIERMKGQYGKYEQLESAFQQNPQFAQQIWDMYNKAQNGTLTQDQTETAPELKQFQDQLFELQRRDHERASEHEEWKNQQADIALEKEIGDLREKYSDHDWDLDDGDGSLMHRILKHAYDENLTLDRAYKDLMWDTRMVDVKAQALKEAQAKRVADKKAGVIVDGPSRKPQEPDFDYSKASWNQVAEKALSDFKHMK